MRRNDCIRVLLTVRKQPTPLTRLVLTASTRTLTEPFVPTSTPSYILQAKRTASSLANTVSVPSPPIEVVLLMIELENYTNDKRAPINQQHVKNILRKFEDEPVIYKLLLQQLLDFEQKHAQFRGTLIHGRIVFFVIQNYANRNQVEQADELLTFCHLNRIDLPPKSIGIVMNAYAKRKSPAALKRVEEIVKAMEEERLQQTSASTQLNYFTYNTLMNAYVGVLRQQSVTAVQQTIERMQTLSERFEDKSLRPNLVSYSILVKACILERQPGFAVKVNAVLDQLKSDTYYAEQPEKDKWYIECLAMDAWSKSGDQQAPKRARHIFDAMIKPNTVAYNTLCNIYAKIGNVNEVFRLYQKMQTDFESGKNKECRPDMHTFGTVLNALQKSDCSDAAEKAEQIFHLISSPNTVAYSTLLNIYAQKGDVEKALNVLRRMQAEIASGKNKDSLPDVPTYNTMLVALLKSGRSDAAEKAEQIFNAISLPDTITYNTLMNIYASKGDADKVLNLVERMQSDFNAGKNKNCCPTMPTYAHVLNALQKSNRSDAAEMAERIFNALSSPTTVVCNILLNIYAEHGKYQDAIALTRRMQSEFDSGTNRHCPPDDTTHNTLVKALQIANDRALANKARDVIEWFRKQPV
jgi:pentatricopeptide repeat protein